MNAANERRVALLNKCQDISSYKEELNNIIEKLNEFSSGEYDIKSVVLSGADHTDIISISYAFYDNGTYTSDDYVYEFKHCCCVDVFGRILSEGCIFSNFTIRNTRLDLLIKYECDLTDFTFENVIFDDSEFHKFNFFDSKFIDCEFNQVKFKKCVFCDGDIVSSKMDVVTFKKCRFINFKLRESKLNSLIFKGCVPEFTNMVNNTFKLLQYSIANDRLDKQLKFKGVIEEMLIKLGNVL